MGREPRRPTLALQRGRARAGAECEVKSQLDGDKLQRGRARAGAGMGSDAETFPD